MPPSLQNRQDQDMLLSRKQLADLTGRTRKSAQIKWLRDHGWPHATDADGHPKVLAAYAMERLGGVSSAPEPRPQLHLP